MSGTTDLICLVDVKWWGFMQCLVNFVTEQWLLSSRGRLTLSTDMRRPHRLCYDFQCHYVLCQLFVPLSSNTQALLCSSKSQALLFIHKVVSILLFFYSFPAEYHIQLFAWSEYFQCRLFHPALLDGLQLPWTLSSTQFQFLPPKSSVTQDCFLVRNILVLFSLTYQIDISILETLRINTAKYRSHSFSSCFTEDKQTYS